MDFFWLTLILVTIVIGIITVLVMEKGKRKESTKKSSESSQTPKENVLPQPPKTVIPDDVVNETKETLRLLDVERTILSDAVRHLYEASAEGKITEEERDKILQKYSLDLSRIKQGIEKSESIIALSELEKVREELIKMFSEQFEEINRKIEELRVKIGEVIQSSKEPISVEATKQPVSLESMKEEPNKLEEEKVLKPSTEKTVETKKKISKPKHVPESEVDDAEKKVEQILADVEQVLKKLSQLEVEE
ncbi:MAG: hypothetical protein QXH91_08220 [Candidatus Bathyarchaeia archaeon]